MFYTKHFQQLFAQHQLANFDAIWAHEITWVEPPNERRGGWSGAGKLILQAENGESLTFFVKKQQNHGRRTLRHPIVGEPTFRREVKNLTFLAEHNIGSPKVVYYAEQANKLQAILITLELPAFVPLDTIDLTSMNDAQQIKLVQAIASEIKRFHDVGMVHRALYPKHIFVKNIDTQPEIALIDCEKMRHHNKENKRAIFDLAALNRHSPSLTNTQRLRFLKYYLNVDKLNQPSKLLTRKILERAARK